MPYDSDDSVPDYVPKGKRKQWRVIWNKTYEEASGSHKEKETAAFQAAGVVFKLYKQDGIGWVGCDLDGTLAQDGHPGIIKEIGPPVLKMLALVRGLLAGGVEIRIVTARVSPDLPEEEVTEQFGMIRDWVFKYVGRELMIQADKDPNMICIYDDRAIAVERNTGELMGWGTSFPNLENPTNR